ncbi:hypothetical protein AS888_24305 [Peribacillus simplex]|uniref:DUF5666 domain-containing protein n=1 Tax=Peribacillus simplex TaxID=1478 RepID=A0A109MVY8_9BACI|nr:hypothetical protein [Peribacillus simplex]KWW16553.1 hypothetical protein AS888_24305 [Peribacillus simplex]
MKKIFVALPVMTMLVSGFTYSTTDARSAVGHLTDNPESNLTSEVKPEEEPKQEEVVKNNNGSAVGHLPSNPESNTTSEVKPEEEPKQEEVVEDKVTVNNLKAGNNVTIEGNTMEMAPYYEIYVNEKPVIFTVKDKVNPKVYSTKVSNLNKGDIVTVYASYMDATSRYVHGSVTTIVQ